jgi:hypothetical protein
MYTVVPSDSLYLCNPSVLLSSVFPRLPLDVLSYVVMSGDLLLFRSRQTSSSPACISQILPIDNMHDHRDRRM